MSKKPFMSGYRTYDTSKGFGSQDEWKKIFEHRLGIDAAQEALGSDNPHSILGVKLTATWSEIKAAYRKLVMIHHPDKGGDAATFRKIQGAYEVLEYKRK
jgi:DnaJ-class molecular chaperone